MFDLLNTARPPAFSAARQMHLRLGLLALCLGMMLPPAVQAGDREVQEEYSKTFPASPTIEVEIANVTGETVIRSWDRSEVLVEAILSARAGSQDEAEDLLHRLSIDTNGDQDHLIIRGRYPRRETVGGSLLSAILGISKGRRAKIDFDVRVPEGARLSVSTVSGDVEIRIVAGPVEVDATSGDVLVVGVDKRVNVDCTSGDVEISRAGGEVDVSATSGEVILVAVSGPVAIGVTSGDISGSDLRSGGTISAISGDVELSETEGDFSVSSTSGDVVLDGHRGSLKVSTSSGDITVTALTPLGDHYRIDASSGSVYFGLPPEVSLNLDISTAGGSIHAEYPLEVREVRRNRLVAVAGSGGAQLEITTASGDVQIKER